MGRIPIRAILSCAILVGVVTAGGVLILGAPPTRADLVRQAGERAALAREMTRQISESLDQGRLLDAERLTSGYIAQAPDDTAAWLYYSLVRQKLGDREEATRGWGRLMDLTRRGQGSAGPGQLFMRAWAHYGNGRKRQAITLWKRTAISTQGRTPSGQNYYHVARMLAGLGEREDALTILHLAVSSGFRQAMVLKADPAMEPLRDSPRYATALDRIARASMGRAPWHGSPNQGETSQILSVEPTPEQRIRRWIESWGDI